MGNAANILVYDQFVNTVQDKSLFTHVRIGMIKLMYEALIVKKHSREKKVCHLTITEKFKN
jgi:hypothetical protein